MLLSMAIQIPIQTPAFIDMRETVRLKIVTTYFLRLFIKNL